MNPKQLIKYLTPTTNQIGVVAIKWLKNLNKTHTTVVSNKNGATETRAIWIKRTDIDPGKIPTLVAHLDTVSDYDIAPRKKDIKIKDNILSLKLNAPEGISCLGGDDRAGLALIVETVKVLQQAKRKINFNILLTFGEERGCVGTKAFIENIKDKFNASFMLEFDRRGHDYVQYNCKSEPFLKQIGNIYNRDKGYGSVSDIKHFQNEYNINSANIGIGFHNEHTRSETWDFDEWFKTVQSTINLVCNDELMTKLGMLPWVKATTTTTYKYVKPLQSILFDFGRELEKYLTDKVETIQDKIIDKITDAIQEKFDELVETKVEDEEAEDPCIQGDHCYAGHNSECVYCGCVNPNAPWDDEREWYNQEGI